MKSGLVATYKVEYITIDHEKAMYNIELKRMAKRMLLKDWESKSIEMCYEISRNLFYFTMGFSFGVIAMILFGGE